MSTTVLNQRTAARKSPSGSTIASVFAVLAIAAVIGYGIAQDNDQTSSGTGVAGVETASQADVKFFEQANAIRRAELAATLPATDSIWSGQADLVNGQATTSVSALPRTDGFWSGQSDLVNGEAYKFNGEAFGPVVTQTDTGAVLYGPMALSEADLQAFEMGYSHTPTTDSVVSGGWDVINGGVVEESKSEATALNGGPRSPLNVE